MIGFVISLSIYILLVVKFRKHSVLLLEKKQQQYAICDEMLCL